DGIRDFHVTGVQTCALPISLLVLMSGLSIYFFTHYFGAEAEKKSGDIHTVVFWNMAQNNPIPSEILIETINKEQPKIIGLVEARSEESRVGKECRARCEQGR